MEEMSGEDKEKRERTKRDAEGETSENEAAGSPGPGPMGTGDPEAGESGPMGTESARPNRDAASRDKTDAGSERDD